MISRIDDEIKETQRKLVEKNREAHLLHSQLEHLQKLKEPLRFHLTGFLDSCESSLSGGQYSDRSIVKINYVLHGHNSSGKLRLEMPVWSLDEIQKTSDRAQRGTMFDFIISERQ